MKTKMQLASELSERINRLPIDTRGHQKTTTYQHREGLGWFYWADNEPEQGPFAEIWDAFEARDEKFGPRILDIKANMLITEITLKLSKPRNE